MKHLFQTGDQQHFSRLVTAEDCATFDSGTVHPVYATFALARDAEWCSRLFALQMKDEEEEGIGTQLSITHHAPAPIGSTVHFTATIHRLQHHEIICDFTAHHGDRLIASGQTGQKILPKKKLEQLFSQLK
ncbi:hypothetical protein KTO58_01860 [Chitinophaga pendula]|uniref:thioesterase family protein n=1 Tax=Chitinophaga TaxID=79328 RepID=UPI000BAEE4A5|nr:MULTISPECIES: hypothetical protein [Chitinophaga]ASZ14398.1 hypothetical protein CK934_27365 [Chitinophaga sp. MD30]UCJ07950.1 hypothetical protein KTO58_01860 [Chitinophaga pendula]